MRPSQFRPKMLSGGRSPTLPMGRRTKKVRQLARAKHRGAPTFLRKGWRRRRKQSSKAKVIPATGLRRSDRYSVIGTRRRPGLTGSKPRPVRYGKIRAINPFCIRSVRAQYRVSLARRAHVQCTARKSAAAPQYTMTKGLELVDRATTRIEELKDTLRGAMPPHNPATPPPENEAPAETSACPFEPAEQDALSAVEQAQATPPTEERSRRKDHRVPIATAALQLAISEAIKATPDCEAFVGVIVEKTKSKSRLDANWSIRGIKFGKAPKEAVNQALTGIVQRLQQDFTLSER